MKRPNIKLPRNGSRNEVTFDVESEIDSDGSGVMVEQQDARPKDAKSPLLGKAEHRKVTPAISPDSRHSAGSSSGSRISSTSQSATQPAKKLAAGTVVGRRPCEYATLLLRSLIKHWFLVGTALSIVAAQIYPWLGSDAGPLRPQITVKYGAVVLIFFVSGVTMKTETMVDTIRDWRLHLFIQFFALGLVPVLVIVSMLPVLSALGLPAGLVEGFRVVACMPPPVSTSVILTKAAGGNEAAAVFNSALGSFLGVVVTPILLLVLVDPTAGGAFSAISAPAAAASAESSATELSGTSGTESSAQLLSEIFVELGVTVVLPLGAGQWLRACHHSVGEKADAWKPQLGTLASFTLLVIIYTTFCNTFCQGHCSRKDPFHDPFFGDLESHPAHLSAEAAASSGMAAIRSLEVANSGNGVATIGGGRGRAAAGAGIATRTTRGAAAGGAASSHEHVAGVFDGVSTSALFSCMAAVALLQVVLMVLSFRLSTARALRNAPWKCRFTRPDVVAVVFSSVHKSLTLGVPVLKIVLARHAHALPLLSMPLLMYHPLQIVIGGLAAPAIKAWVNAGEDLGGELPIHHGPAS